MQLVLHRWSRGHSERTEGDEQPSAEETETREENLFRERHGMGRDPQPGCDLGDVVKQQPDNRSVVDSRVCGAKEKLPNLAGPAEEFLYRLQAPGQCVIKCYYYLRHLDPL